MEPGRICWLNAFLSRISKWGQSLELWDTFDVGGGEGATGSRGRWEVRYGHTADVVCLKKFFFYSVPMNRLHYGVFMNS